MTILVATGLQREQRILAGPGMEVVAGGGDRVRLEAMLDRLAPGMRGLISIGLGGALAPGLRPGDWVVAHAVLHGEEQLRTDRRWTDRLVSRLPSPRRGLLIGANAIVSSAGEKAALYRATGAIAVDMESHTAARVALRHRLPFAAARVVSDASDRTLPPAALVGMRPDGGMDLPAVLRSLLAAPRQLPALIRTGLEAERAFRALLSGHRRLGPGLVGPYFGQLPFDMA